MTLVKGSTVLSGQVIRMTIAPATNAKITATRGRTSDAPSARNPILSPLATGGRRSDVSSGGASSSAIHLPPEQHKICLMVLVFAKEYISQKQAPSDKSSTLGWHRFRWHELAGLHLRFQRHRFGQ